MIKFIFYINMIISIFCYNIQTKCNKYNVYIHLEKFNQKYNLIHVGISFKNIINEERFDFRAFNEGNSYITTNKDRSNFYEMFPNLKISNNHKNEMVKDYEEYTNIMINNKDNIFCKSLQWGVTNKTLDEILLYEKKIQNKYIMGIYDCRHYVNKLTTWSLDRPLPIWEIDKLWEEN